MIRLGFNTRARALALTASLLILSGAQVAAQPTAPLTAEERREFEFSGAVHSSYPVSPLTEWDREMRNALSSANGDRAADALASRYGLSPADMRILMRLWVRNELQALLPDQDPRRAELRSALLELLGRNRGSALTLQAVAYALDDIAECRAEDFAALMAGSTDPVGDAWAIAEAATCTDNYLRAAGFSPGRELRPLIRLANWGGLAPRDALPLYAWLVRPANLERIASADRVAVSAWLHQRYARLLFDLGLTERAVALIESLDAAVRERLLRPPTPAFNATIDGGSIAFLPWRGDEAVMLELAAAHALMGRQAEAATELASMPELAAARHAFRCAWRPTTGPANQPCARIPHDQAIDRNIDLLVLDHFLHRPGEDPYPLAETGFAGGGAEARGAAMSAVRCRVFADPSFEICDEERSALRGRLFERTELSASEHSRYRAALAALPLEGFAALAAEAEAQLAAVATALPAAAASEAAPPARQSIAAPPAPFAERPLPPNARGARPPAREIRVRAFPAGFIPVRIEQSGARAVAISVSQTYDPTGEVSQGGYWVHVSDDGGRTWQRPLYTGLADRFPYVVPTSSLLPLLNGDRIDLEVEVAEIDTASITYPPVALRSRRQATGLYLQIPLADLARDSDGDGISDIAAQRLLLDRPRQGGRTPFLVGSDAGAQCPPSDNDRAARTALLGRLFSVRFAPIVEPVDRPAGVEAIGVGWTSAASAVAGPVFLHGDPRDFACLNPDRPMIVYSDADIEALERFRPDFHAVAVPRIIYNRARDRGYVRWSAGWAGGTYRLRLVDGAWQFDEISSWIT